MVLVSVAVVLMVVWMCAGMWWVKAAGARGEADVFVLAQWEAFTDAAAAARSGRYVPPGMPAATAARRFEAAARSCRSTLEAEVLTRRLAVSLWLLCVPVLVTVDVAAFSTVAAMTA